MTESCGVHEHTAASSCPNGNQTSDCLLDLLRRYSEHRQPIALSFRDMVHLVGYPERATHLIHPYPAKLLAHIPYFFLSNDLLSKPGDLVFDPFCGSGTVLLESVLAGRRALGVDINPLAVLISRVKTSELDAQALAQAYVRLAGRIRDKPSMDVPDVIHLDYWFHSHVRDRLLCILEAVNLTRNPAYRDFFLVCLSNCVRRVSLADPRISVPVRLRADQYPEGHLLRKKTEVYLEKLRSVDAVDEFARVVEANIDRVARFSKQRPNGVDAIVCERDIKCSLGSECGDSGVFEPGSAHLIITSPPYAGAQKYIRASSLSLGWLGLATTGDLRCYESDTIGREHYRRVDCEECPSTGVPSADTLIQQVHAVNPLRARIAGTYLVEMQKSIVSMHRMLRLDGYLVLVVGNSQVCGEEFRTSEYLMSMAVDEGLVPTLVLKDDIRSRGLMTKRNKTAGVISTEWVMVFQKRS